MNPYRDATIQDVVEPAKSELLRWAAELSADAIRGHVRIYGPNLVASGPNSTGKTYAVWAMKSYLREMSLRCPYYDTVVPHSPCLEIVSELAVAYEMNESDRIKRVNHYASVEVLCIDDFGHDLTRQQAQGVEQIIERRTHEGLPTMVTTNLTRQMVIDSRGSGVAARLYDGHGDAVVVPLTEGNYRRHT